jgi:non-specific serine/threonine protein kinase/serine/threonine-protein kinase
MDSEQVLARFETERQALALMDHPAIAKVLDAGTTERGRPYFVMELVRGVPITTYCDRHGRSVRERLELFVEVCEGIRYAHQKAVIHRDIKPSNILITETDGRPAPKIIDFGAAEATATRLTERTLFTELGELVGTPEYVSPEQAELTGVNRLIFVWSPQGRAGSSPPRGGRILRSLKKFRSTASVPRRLVFVKIPSFG